MELHVCYGFEKSLLDIIHDTLVKKIKTVTWRMVIQHSSAVKVSRGERNTAVEIAET